MKNFQSTLKNKGEIGSGNFDPAQEIEREIQKFKKT